MDSKLTFTPNTDFIHKKCQQRMYCLQKLRCLDVHTKILRTFYRSLQWSLFSLLRLYAGYGGLSVKKKNVLHRVVSVCSKVVEEQQESLNQLYECRVARKARRIAGDASHILAGNYEYLPSDRCF